VMHVREFSYINWVIIYKCIISIYMCKCIILDMYIVNASVEPCKVVSLHAKHKCQTHKKNMHTLT